ncbi:hypothetical protein HY623_04585 [Candidatus Uhrbacteria bacterium]|nr:hypothetical protein [Candidatus Uhrbacteria bacterium]
MTLRVKIVLIAILSVVGLMILFSAIAVVRYVRAKKEQPLVTQVEEQGNQGSNSSGQASPSSSVGKGAVQAPLSSPPPAEPGEEIVSLALPFVERFGSYSNQGNFENLSDLLPFMGSSMRNWAQKQIAEQVNKPFQELYRGVTTKALSYTMKDYKPEQGRAEILVATQRKELIGSTVNARIYNQDVVVKLVKDDGAWVVDSAYWQ